MKINKLLTSFGVLLLLVSALAAACKSTAAAQTPIGTLTGHIFDHGVDTNANGLYDYLEIDVEINVTIEGSFQVSCIGLLDAQSHVINAYNESEGYLDVGIQYLNLSMSGPLIFGSHLNPQNASLIELFGISSMDSNTVQIIQYLGGAMHYVPLSRIYNYTEFDPPKAFLTGQISDRGIDTDGDGLFNYLQVGVELNVTQPGEYQVAAQGLTGETQSAGSSSFYDYQQDMENFNYGIQTAYLNFSGPGIASSYINPTQVDYLSIMDGVNLLSQLDSAPLSKQYDYTLFNKPSKDIQVNFKVYPNATVALDGALNFTHIYPENTYEPQINATMGFSTSGNTTTGTSNGTIAFPENPYASDNSIEEHTRSIYENGLENETLNTSEVLTPELADTYPFNASDFNLNSSYAGGLFNVDISEQTATPTIYNAVFPFNMSDATLLADFDGAEVNGNITFHAISGLSAADITVSFSGNRSSVNFYGNMNVTYASYGEFQINETVLDQKIADLEANLTGQGVGSLYNESGGYLSCVSQPNITKIPWSDPTLGAYVEYNFTVVGNFTAGLAAMLYPLGSSSAGLEGFVYACLESTATSVNNASLVLSYYHNTQTEQVDMHLTIDANALFNSLLLLAPPAVSQSSYSATEQTQIEAFLKIANATAYGLTDANINAAYSSAEKQFTMNMWTSANATQLKEDILPVLPETAPINLHDTFESFFNATYGETTYANTTLDVVNGTGTFASTMTFRGDFNAELNNIKNFCVAILSPQGSEQPWDLRLLNETEINVNDLQVEFGIGQSWMYTNFSGLILQPPADEVDSLAFKLKSWLNTANDPTMSPGDFEKITITVTGESSANETVILSQPSGMPVPDSSSEDYGSMVWNNASVSNLQDLTFLVASREQVNYNGGAFDIPILTNSTVTDFSFDAGAKRIAFNVSGSPGHGYCNVTIPRDLLNASALRDWTITFDGTNLAQGEFSITQNSEYVFVYLNYTHSEHAITISGTQLVPEYQPDFVPAVLVTLLIIAAVIALKRKRPESIKTRFHETLMKIRLLSRSN